MTRINVTEKRKRNSFFYIRAIRGHSVLSLQPKAALGFSLMSNTMFPDMLRSAIDRGSLDTTEFAIECSTAILFGLEPAI